ncbi:phage holin family protein [Pseudorhodoplanes sinuspersici]
MDRFINNLRVLWRADSAIADIRLRHALARSGFNAAAALIALFGLLMLELAAYFALLQVWGAIASAVTLGLINFAVAGILFLIASRQKPGRELELANEIHNSAMQALQADARLLQSEVAAFGNAVKHPMDSALGALPTLIVPLASVLINTLKKPKSEAK